MTELKQRPGRNAAHWLALVYCSACFLLQPRPPAQGGTDLSELGSPIASIIQEIAIPSPLQGNFE